MVIGGQQVLVADRKLGLKQVPVVLVDLSEEQAHLLNLALTRISGTWDKELLAHLLADLNAVPDVHGKRENAWRPLTWMRPWKPPRRFVATRRSPVPLW